MDYVLAFEALTIEESVINDQMLLISVRAEDQVVVNQTLVFLNPAISSEFPHIHWTLTNHTFWGVEEHVLPYDYLNEQVKILLWELCLSFGKFPEDPIS